MLNLQGLLKRGMQDKVMFKKQLRWFRIFFRRSYQHGFFQIAESVACLYSFEQGIFFVGGPEYQDTTWRLEQGENPSHKILHLNLQHRFMWYMIGRLKSEEHTSELQSQFHLV